MEFFSFFPKPTRRKQAVSIAAITAAAVVAAIALILWLLPKPEAPHRLQGSWQCDGFFLTADAQNLCLNGCALSTSCWSRWRKTRGRTVRSSLCWMPARWVSCAANITLKIISCICRWTGRKKFFLRLSLRLLRR